MCPRGWRVPSKSDWQSMIDLVGGENIGGRFEELTNSCLFNKDQIVRIYRCIKIGAKFLQE